MLLYFFFGNYKQVFRWSADAFLTDLEPGQNLLKFIKDILTGKKHPPIKLKHLHIEYENLGR